MHFTRRSLMGLAAGGLAVAFLPASAAFAFTGKTAEAIAKFAGGTPSGTGKIDLQIPEIAENGNNVPVAFTVSSKMEGDDVVESVLILADGNPSPVVATFHFSELSGEASATTRVRLATTQNIVAVVKMKNGNVFTESKQVKVTIGGCGG